MAALVSYDSLMHFELTKSIIYQALTEFMSSQLLDPLKLKNLQVDLLQKVKNHIFKLKKTKFNINYYIPHSYCDGYALLKCIIKHDIGGEMITKDLFKAITEKKNM